MNAQQLKNSILQEAIEGRLVPQDPNDEPASVLLGKIRKEKARLVKEGKLKKKGLEEISVTEEEKPFQIPESWEWVRIGCLCQVLDIDHKMPEKVINGVPYISPLDFYGTNGINYDSAKKISVEDFESLSRKCLPRKGDIIFPRYGTIGVVRLVDTDRDFLVSYSCATIKIISSNLQGKYLYYVLQSPFIRLIEIDKYINKTTQPNVGLQSILKFIFPLPPLAEQKRIVAKIEELLPKVEEYGKAQESLDKLNEGLPERLKKSILQEAIEGRLVPQAPNDEPASVLLDKIRKEKAKLVKEGKLKKKDLIETPIDEDEIPFKIPESWEWCRVSTILNILDSQRKPVTKSDREAGIYPYCGANGILDYVKDYIFDGKFVLVGEDGSVVTKYGNPVVNKIEGKIWVNNHAHILQEFGNLGYQDYIYYALVNTDISLFIHGFMPKYSQSDLRKTLIPLPPLAEQHRIVEKIEQLFEKTDKLKK